MHVQCIRIRITLVTPSLVWEESLALELPTGDSSSGFQGESASTAVSIVGDSSPGLHHGGLLVTPPQGDEESQPQVQWHSWFLKHMQHAKPTG